MKPTLKIDFVSDVACPWCAIGLAALEKALERVQGEVQAQLHFQPFELNPDMGPEGEDTTGYLSRKYGSTAEQQAANRAAMAQRGEAVGFAFRQGGRPRIWNTFDAHRGLHWAGLQGGDAQHRLKKALLQAYHGEGLNPADPGVLTAACEQAGLPAGQAAEILKGDLYTGEVRARERFYTSAGIHAVPSVIINDQHLVQGGQPVEAFEHALRQIAQGL